MTQALKASAFPDPELPEDMNPELPENDFLYHFNIDRYGKLLQQDFPGQSIEEIFGDATHVVTGGSGERAGRINKNILDECNHVEVFEIPYINAIGKTERFSLYKTGSVISVSHGMGMPSLSICMHEITKLLIYAKGGNKEGNFDAAVQKMRDEVKFIRVGTSGGVGVDAGTVVITENGVNPRGEKKHTETILMEDHSFPTHLDTGLLQEIQAANIESEIGKKINVVLGDTMGTNCFYEGQGRRDGVLKPGYSEKQRIEYLERVQKLGVKNFEMESTGFASFCLRAGIPGSIVCVALLDRFKGDQVHVPEDITENAEKIVMNYLRKVGAIIPRTTDPSKLPLRLDFDDGPMILGLQEDDHAQGLRREIIKGMKSGEDCETRIVKYRQLLEELVNPKGEKYSDIAINLAMAIIYYEGNDAKKCIEHMRHVEGFAIQEGYADIETMLRHLDM